MTWSGSCHCGAVRFEVSAQIDELTTCDCSLCVKKNAVMAKVHEDALTVTAGEEALSLYQWNTRRAKHYFCSRCGIYTFHRKRSAPDHYGVNVFCLDNFDVASMPVRATEGASMTLAPDGARSEWPGPRASEA
ncbi:GFA family protein [Phenylobacterium sp.]|uniref:GFA family protein n=1 Tax=Phenylobacterium sp. TaxID=1871053 RepID=UPI00272F050D|nr:GFA family protein [Phenylobacterium sp.]MDP1597664.1 GFA family protein [Phenylobacterium sp.]MDP3592420.1 GFA family protein [Phenylobacterium sp.]